MDSMFVEENSMMSKTPARSQEEIESRGTEIYELKIRQSLDETHDGMFVAIDIDSGDFELDEDDLTATLRLRGRKPFADVWLMMAGFRSAYRIGYAK
jgi:hypothetical protein